MKLGILLLGILDSKIIDYLGRSYQTDHISFIRPEKSGATLVLDTFRKVRGQPKCDVFVIACRDKRTQMGLFFFKLISFFSNCKKRLVVDSTLTEEPISLAHFVFVGIPRFVLELACSLYVLLLSWIRVNRLKARKTSREPIVFKAIRKIAYLRTNLWFGVKGGGSVGHIAGVANALHRQGYQLFFASSDKLEMVDESRTPVRVIPPSTLFTNTMEIPELAYNMKFIKATAKIFGEELPDLIYQRCSLDDYSGVTLAQKFGVPLVLEYNSSEVWIAENWGGKLIFGNIAKAIEELNLKRADLVVVVSKALEEDLLSRGVENHKILVNPNGVDPEIFYNSKYESEALELRHGLGIENKVAVGFLGTFGYWHGAEVLAKAVKLMVNRNEDIHLLFMGDGLLLGKVKSIIKGTQMNRHVTFTGLIPQREAPKYLAACDILTSPTVPNPDGTEFFGSPTKLFEYMAMAKGIVASKIGQIGEILTHEETAILVEPGNVEQLARGILQLAEDKHLREQLGSMARKVVISQYTWEQNVKRVIQALENLRTRR